MNRRQFNTSLLAGATLIAAPHIARSQTVFTLRLGHFVAPQHFFSVYLQKWVDELKEKSGGRLNITIFPANAMGPTQDYYDYARSGVADITWYLTGATPGRFPRTEIIQLPYMAGSAEIGTKTLNDPDVLKLLAPEYQGVRLLYLLTTPPGVLLTAKTPVRAAADMKGMRVRFASVTIKSFISALGATPVGVPPSGMADALRNGAIDGVFTHYGSAHTAFRLGGPVKYSTDLYAYVSSFGVAMNQASYDKLPSDLQTLIDDTTRPRIAEIGQLWDAADAPGKQYLVSEGATVITLAQEEDARFKKIGAEDATRVLAELDKSQPAGKVHAAMKAAAAKAAQSSFSFWKT